MEAVFSEILPMAQESSQESSLGKRIGFWAAVCIPIALVLISIVVFFVRLQVDVSYIKSNFATSTQLDRLGIALELFANDVAAIHPEIKPERYQRLLSTSATPVLKIWPAEGEIRESANGVGIIPQQFGLETPVQAVLNGTVASARGSDIVIHWMPIEGSTGTTDPDVPIWSTIYRHVSDIYVTEGQKVKAGEVIGTFTCRAEPDECLLFSLKRDDDVVDALAFLPASLF